MAITARLCYLVNEFAEQCGVAVDVTLRILETFQLGASEKYSLVSTLRAEHHSEAISTNTALMAEGLDLGTTVVRPRTSATIGARIPPPELVPTIILEDEVDDEKQSLPADNTGVRGHTSTALSCSSNMILTHTEAAAMPLKEIMPSGPTRKRKKKVKPRNEIDDIFGF
ncbi:hypothetical protein FRB93_000969 [Tulasnella sp. JGI-2019a]|nr:hypothetical protein FRB93_000969 [Tulasnella sp. JGI-2019a]